MSRVAYVNGRYIPQRDASVNIEDRGYQFGDGIYEVLYFRPTGFVDTDLHLDRLQRSLDEVRIAMPMPRAACLASTLASRFTLLMSQRPQRSSGRVMAAAAQAAGSVGNGGVRRAVTTRAGGVPGAGKTCSRRATPRVTCM